MKKDKQTIKLRGHYDTIVSRVNMSIKNLKFQQVSLFYTFTCSVSYFFNGNNIDLLIVFLFC